MTVRLLLASPVLTLAALLAAAAEPSAPAGPAKPSAPAAQPDPNAAIRQALDAYLDRRWLPQAEADKSTGEVLKKLSQPGCTIEDVERWLRAGRVQYEAPKTQGKLALVQGLQCDHVDYKTRLFLYVPKSYDPKKPAPLLLVGHGGNGAMSADYALKATLGGIVPWLPVVEQKGLLLAAPLSERGWGAIGNSILLSAISWAQRTLHVDADRIYVTGHSMGGHLSWRSGIYLGDRWGAVAPMSGGYDYVSDKQVFSLVNVPGYATFGKSEPYHINDYNRRIGPWMTEHRFDWHLVEKPGGHEIFADELPKVADFLLAHPRHLYRTRVYGVGGTSLAYNDPEKNEKWSQQHTWNPQRPIPFSTFHWLRLYAQPQDAPKEKSPQRVWAENLGENRIRVTSQFARRVRIYLHPKMVDFSKPVEVTANSRTVFRDKVTPSLKTMLELVREFDDRGRIFYAGIDVDIPTDAEVPEPRGEAAGAARRQDTGPCHRHAALSIPATESIGRQPDVVLSPAEGRGMRRQGPLECCLRPRSPERQNPRG